MSKGRRAAPDSASARLCEWRGLNCCAFVVEKEKLCFGERKKVLTNTLWGYILSVTGKNTPVGYSCFKDREAQTLRQDVQTPHGTGTMRGDRFWERPGKRKMRMKKENDTALPAGEECGCRRKATPRKEKEIRQLKNRLNRMTGQLNGIGRMLDENRYCGDILTQVAAVESALQSFGYLILEEHMKTCVAEEITKGNTDVIGEAVELVKKLK